MSPIPTLPPFHTIRFTADREYVYSHEPVFEILWTYLNDEATIAEPVKMMAKDVPPKYPVWKNEYNCQVVCDVLNKPKEHARVIHQSKMNNPDFVC